MNITRIRALLSLTLLVVFSISLITGIGLFFSPSGKVAKEIGWMFLGLNKEKLENLHTISSFLMSILVLIHLTINYKMFLSEMKILLKNK